MNGPFDIRIEHLIEQVHRLGPRPFLELVRELADEHGIPGDVLVEKMEKFAGMDAGMVQAVGGNVFPIRPLMPVPDPGRDGGDDLRGAA